MLFQNHFKQNGGSYRVYDEGVGDGSIYEGVGVGVGNSSTISNASDSSWDDYYK